MTQSVGYEDYLIYFLNPSIRKISEKLGSFRHSTLLNHSDHRLNSFKFSFGYDDSTKTYKVVAFQTSTNTDVMCVLDVYSLFARLHRRIKAYVCFGRLC